MKLSRMILCALLALSISLTLALPALADEAAGPSPWAAQTISRAIELGMVPEGLQDDWQQDLTRGEFAELVVHFLAVQYGYGTGTGFRTETFLEDYLNLHIAPNGRPFSKADHLAESELSPDMFFSWQGILDDRMRVFDDVEPYGGAAYINFAYLLGIVQGKGEGRYDPDGPITRQEAAALLARTYTTYGTMEFQNKSTIPFSDSAQIAPWAKENVDAMQNWDVLHGDENGAFLPNEHYTREQGVVAFMRLYQNMPVSRGRGTLAPLLSQEDVVERCASSGSFGESFVQYKAETEICTILCLTYGGVMHPPGPTIFLIYPDSTFKRIELSVTPHDFQLIDQETKLAFAGYPGEQYHLDLRSGILLSDSTHSAKTSQIRGAHHVLPPSFCYGRSTSAS